MFMSLMTVFVHPSASFILLISKVGPTTTFLLESMKAIASVMTSSFPTLRLYNRRRMQGIS